MNYIAIGNGEIDNNETICAGDKIICPKCGKAHKTFGGKEVRSDGTKVKSDILLAFKCKGTLRKIRLDRTLIRPMRHRKYTRRGA